MEPCDLTATQASALIARRKLSCEELARSCLSRMRDREPLIRAWAYFNERSVIQRAQELDRASHRGALHGISIGIKDVIATADMPTSYNSPHYAGHRPGYDAACVAVLRYSGAIILGKTATVEFAAGARKAETRNPHNPDHTPGGSSSGSAACVADRHAPLAIGTQTGGSVIRPAAFTGVYGFKPTHGLVSCAGAYPVAPNLDTIGWFGRSVGDLRLVAQAFQIVSNECNPILSSNITIGILREPLWRHISEPGRNALESAAGKLAAAGRQIKSITPPAAFDALSDAAYRVVAWERRASFLPEFLTFGDALDPSVRGSTEARGMSAADIAEAYDLLANARPTFDALFREEGVDVVMTAASQGEAPEGLLDTGNSVTNTMWTALHVPCLAIPTQRGPHGLPLGVQLIAPRFADDRLLAIAETLAPLVDELTDTSTSVGADAEWKRRPKA